MFKINNKLMMSLSVGIFMTACNSGNSSSAPCNPCTVYAANNKSMGFNGNIKLAAESLLQTSFANAIVAADALCNSDESKPALPNSAYYKALLVENGIRGWNPTINWVIHPNTTYINTNNQVIGISTESSIIDFPTQNSFVSFIGFAWTGLGGSSKSTLWEVNQDTCNGWTSADPELYGSIGFEDYTRSVYESSSYQIFSGNTNCNSSNLSGYPSGLICVQQ